MREHVPDGDDVLPGCAELGPPADDAVVEADVPPLDEEEQAGGGDRLHHRVGVDDRVARPESPGRVGRPPDEIDDGSPVDDHPEGCTDLAAVGESRGERVRHGRKGRIDVSAGRRARHPGCLPDGGAVSCRSRAGRPRSGARGRGRGPPARRPRDGLASGCGPARRSGPRARPTRAGGRTGTTAQRASRAPRSTSCEPRSWPLLLSLPVSPSRSRGCLRTSLGHGGGQASRAYGGPHRQPGAGGAGRPRRVRSGGRGRRRRPARPAHRGSRAPARRAGRGRALAAPADALLADPRDCAGQRRARARRERGSQTPRGRPGIARLAGVPLERGLPRPPRPRDPGPARRREEHGLRHRDARRARDRRSLRGGVGGRALTRAGCGGPPSGAAAARRAVRAARGVGGRVARGDPASRPPRRAGGPPVGAPDRRRRRLRALRLRHDPLPRALPASARPVAGRDRGGVGAARGGTASRSRSRAAGTSRGGSGT